MTTEQKIIQEFSMPYDLINKVSILIGTCQRDNNSDWTGYLIEKATGKCA
jgi:hypothetical protein